MLFGEVRLCCLERCVVLFGKVRLFCLKMLCCLVLRGSVVLFGEVHGLCCLER